MGTKTYQLSLQNKKHREFQGFENELKVVFSKIVFILCRSFFLLMIDGCLVI
jgi:hypothetical protein